LYPVNLSGRGCVMNRFSPGLFLALLLIALTLAQGLAQGDESGLNSSASSALAPLSDENMASTEAVDNSAAVDEAETMDQLIQTISDSSDGTEETAAVSGTTEAQEADQSTTALEEDSSAAEADGSGTIEEAEEMDQLIQVLVEDEGSTNGAVDADQGAGASGKEEATNQSIGISIEDAGEVPAKSGQDSGALNQTQSMDKLIRTLVDSGSEGNNSSETVQDARSVNETGPAGEPIQTPAKDDGAIVAETSQQAEIQEKTESISKLMQTLAYNESNTSTMTDSSEEMIKKTESMDQLIQTLEVKRDEATSSDEVVSGQGLEIIDEEVSMEMMIQALASDGSDVQ
ncbi:MAG: hypothetical protein QUS09_07835, partial [Methanotrichaceae archaeon]|nr:hypothetical protein [Methanotrichaceae archaeon]